MSITNIKPIKTALISVFDKTGLEPLVMELHKEGTTFISTGGTAVFLRELGLSVVEVSEITGFPEILEGRVKTLHPLIFGGILARHGHELHDKHIEDHGILPIDLVIIDLYPFTDTLKKTDEHQEIIEKIDIGGVALIRAAAKNYEHCTIVASRKNYSRLLDILKEQKGLTMEQRLAFAGEAFAVTSVLDLEVSNYLMNQVSKPQGALRYGENPHQKGRFIGDTTSFMNVMNGKALSYNNKADLDAGLNLLSNFEQPTFCILKHSNPCGLASGITIMEAWEKALACDPSSAFGGILLTNGLVTAHLAEKINDIFYEILAAPGFEPEALEVLKSKKNRILIQIEHYPEKNLELKSALNGFLIQEPDRNFSAPETWEVKTGKVSESQHADLIFAEKAVRHLKSNAIALVRNQQLIGAGIGQTSRIQALEQAIAKARHMGFDIQNAVLASDAFFPFSDCAQIAKEAGISLILQPGGSIRDEESIEYCRKNNMTLIFTGIRHFWH